MRMTVSAESPADQARSLLPKRVLGIAFACVGTGLALFIAFFGLLPHPQFLATPLPIVGAIALALAAFGIWLAMRPSVRKSRSAQGSATAAMLKSDGARPISKRALQVVGIVMLGLAAPLIMFGLIGITTPSTASFAWGCIWLGASLIVSFWLLLTLRTRHGQEGFVRAAQQLAAVRSHWEDGAGIAVSPDSQKILIASGKLRRVYDFADIREVSFEHQTPGLAFGRNASAKILSDTLRADLANGIVLDTRDVDHPTWHVPVRREKDLLSWREVLRRALED